MATKDSSKKLFIIHQIESETGKIISILADLQGPKIRLGIIPDDKQLVSTGEQIILSTKAGKNTVHIPP